MNLHEKLFEIQKTVTYIQKNAQGYQYKYASGTDVLAPIRAKMDELKLMLLPRVVGSKAERGEAVDDKGKVKIQFFTEVTIEFTWVNVEKPEETMTIPWYAQGVDPAEKGVGKAWTYAERYFMLKFFHIPTDNDDPDAYQQKREVAGRRRPAKAPQPVQPPPTLAGKPAPPNPWRGLLVGISDPISGVNDGKPYTWWQIETEEMKLSTMDHGVAEVASQSIQDGSIVEIIWKLKKSKKTGAEFCNAETIMVVENELEAGFQRKVG